MVFKVGIISPFSGLILWIHQIIVIIWINNKDIAHLK